MSVQSWLAWDRRSVLKTFALGSLILLTAAWAVQHFALKALTDGAPLLHLNQTVTSRPLPNNKSLIAVDLTVKNEGQASLKALRGHVEVHQVLPVTTQAQRLLSGINAVNSHADWGPALGRQDEDRGRILQAGEVVELHYEFIVPGSICVIDVASVLENPKLNASGRRVNWERVTTQDIEPAGKCSSAFEVHPAAAGGPLSAGSSASERKRTPPAKTAEFVEDVPAVIEGL